MPSGTEMVMPGDNVELEVELITPIAMDKELRFAIREGGHTVGAGVVTDIVSWIPMAGNSKRTIIHLESTAGTGYRYTVTKSKRLHPGRIEFKKYDPVIRKHVIFKETK